MRFPRVMAVMASVLAVAMSPGGLAADPDEDDVPPFARRIDLSGPRFGVSLLSPGIVDRIASESDQQVGTVVTQFGWQFEKRFGSGGGKGLTGVTEWILLVGGMEHNAFLPSINWLVGLRTRSGTEFGAGPNISPAGTAIVLAAGKTFRAGALNLPVNLALVPSASGVRLTLLCGFNTRR